MIEVLGINRRGAPGRTDAGRTKATGMHVVGRNKLATNPTGGEEQHAPLALQCEFPAHRKPDTPDGHTHAPPILLRLRRWRVHRNVARSVDALLDFVSRKGLSLAHVSGDQDSAGQGSGTGAREGVRQLPEALALSEIRTFVPGAAGGEDRIMVTFESPQAARLAGAKLGWA